VYSGVKPIKDRDVIALYDAAIKQSKDVKWNNGTNMDMMLEFLFNKISGETRAVIYTDGYFEKSSTDIGKLNATATALGKKGLLEIEFIGVRLENKEKIYSWFKNTNINIIFTSMT